MSRKSFRVTVANEERLREARVLKRLPHCFGRNQRLPAGLEGATIIRIGSLQENDLVEGGGFVIDYRPKGSDATRRVVLAFDETAIWTAAYFSTV